MIDPAPIRARFASLSPHLDERGQRLLAASEAQAAGHGGIVAVARATGIAPSPIWQGLRELAEDAVLEGVWVRQPDGGRKALAASDPGLLGALLALVLPSERGDPYVAAALELQEPAQACVRACGSGPSGQPHGGGRAADGRELQPSSKPKDPEGSGHPDRDPQFAHIAQGVSQALAGGQPVISVDTKKKELVGPVRNAGQAWGPRGTPEQLRVHDFLIEELGRAVPYGVYDLAANTGWVSVGMDEDTADFAAQNIRCWWQEQGRPHYPEARRLVLTADGGGSNGSRVRLWRRELQRLSDELDIAVIVHHLLPGTS